MRGLEPLILAAWSLRIALIQPEIPQNVGAVLRLGACLGVPVDLVGPLGFVASDARMRRAGMDYLDLAAVSRHASWQAFQEDARGRLVLMTTHADRSFYDATLRADDILLFGSESSGAPAEVHRAADLRLRLPMRAEARSLNLALAVAMAAGEALRQTGGLPPMEIVDR